MRLVANLRADGHVERPNALDRHGLHSGILADGNLRVDRISLRRFSAVLSALLAAYLVIGPSEEGTHWGYVNAVCPVVLLLMALWTCFKIIIGNTRTMWTPLPWLILSGALYFGLGPLIYIFGSEEAIAYMDNFWPVLPQDLWRTNVLNVVGLLSIFVAFLGADKFLEKVRSTDRETTETAGSGDAGATVSAFVFLGVGLPLRYLLILPYTFGQLDFQLPGVIYSLNCIVSVAVFMMAYLSSKRGGMWRVGFWFLFVSELISNFICYTKLAVLLVFVMAALGRYQAKQNIKELFISGLAVFAFYSFFLSPMVTWGRLQLLREGAGEFEKAPPGLRLSVAAQGVELWVQGALEVENAQRSNSWTRICYTNMQTAAMRLYDSGAVGESFQVALYVWIPRFIWRDKPQVTLGEDFTEVVQGRRGNNTAPGAFGEAYWNGGWFLVILACGYLGVLFAWLSHVALGMLARSQWLLLPCAFLGIFMGLRIDDWFAPTYIVGFMMYLVYYISIRVVLAKAKE